MNDSGGGMIVMMVYLFVMFIAVACIAGFWRVFTKAGQPGWACLIPIYSNVVMARIAGLPVWTVLLLFVPFIGFLVAVYTLHRIFQSFGKSAIWTVGIFVPFVLPLEILALGFGDAQYQGAEEGGMGMSRF